MLLGSRPSGILTGIIKPSYHKRYSQLDRKVHLSRSSRDSRPLSHETLPAPDPDVPSWIPKNATSGQQSDNSASHFAPDESNGHGLLFGLETSETSTGDFSQRMTKALGGPLLSRTWIIPIWWLKSPITVLKKVIWDEIGQTVDGATKDGACLDETLSHMLPLRTLSIKNNHQFSIGFLDIHSIQRLSMEENIVPDGDLLLEPRSESSNRLLVVVVFKLPDLPNEYLAPVRFELLRFHSIYPGGRIAAVFVPPKP